MNQPTLITTLKASIGTTAAEFTTAADADFKRHLSYAARDYSRFRPRTLLDTLTLVADQGDYDAPADLLAVKTSEWGRSERERVALWDRTAVHELPRLSSAAGKVWLTPAPTAAQIGCFGSAYKYFYFAAHLVDESTVTVPDGDEALLIVRAQAEVAKELAARGMTKPVAGWHNGLQSVAKPMTPAEIHKMLMSTFARMAAR